jgi:hypothetical protein
LATELLAKNPVLLAKVVNDLQLALVHPAGNGDQHKPEWIEISQGFQSSLSRVPAKVGDHRRFMQIQFPDHTTSSRIISITVASFFNNPVKKFH